MGKYTVGIDFGSLSGRAVLVNVETGEELATSVYDYPHGVMDTILPDGTPLGQDWALQNPQDYLEVYTNTIPAVLKESGIDPIDVIGVGIDFTACTMLPIKKDGTPLCFIKEYKSEPHAYVKLWKHHAAQGQANRLNELAHKREESWINRYGGKISSEWEVPKVMQILEEAPHIYGAMDHWIEGADWAVFALTGKITRNECTAGYKGMWHKKDGYPSKDFFGNLHPGLENYVADKLDYPFVSLGDKVGGLTKEMAERTGLPAGIAVAAGNIDAHVTVPAVKIDGSGKMLAIIGTSTCHILLDQTEATVPGMCGVVEGGVYPDFFGYEAGQSCVGDHFAWFVENCVPPIYYEEAEKQGKNIHVYLTQLAEKMAVGESGLIALDWWNGNRSVLVDVDLTGLLIGMTLQTKPEEIYRALIEATAYGSRKIVETFRKNGVEIAEFYASGGISQKNPMAMQIYSDVLNMPVKIAGSDQGPALGSGIFAAVAAGKENGGVANIFEGAAQMGSLKELVYQPIPLNAKTYDLLYEEYSVLHDYFGRGANDIMKRLKKIKADVTQEGN